MAIKMNLMEGKEKTELMTRVDGNGKNKNTTRQA